jgi:hypothetical protein
MGNRRAAEDGNAQAMRESLEFPNTWRELLKRARKGQPFRKVARGTGVGPGYISTLEHVQRAPGIVIAEA